MLPTRNGSFHLFKFAGVNVFLHWSWFLVAVYQISYRKGLYTSDIWCVLEYLALFVIVLLHEFGHALACRSVGGKADQIVLWPLGGVAYVNPPQRPGATLWSIAAGPLVNALLFPILSALCLLGRGQPWVMAQPNLYEFITNLWWINLMLLVFNMLPIYPLDGGQVLRSILWFMVGRCDWHHRHRRAADLRHPHAVAGDHSGVRPVAMLERASTSAGDGAGGGGAATAERDLSGLPRRAARGRFLDLRPLPAPVRHLRNAGCVSQLRHDLQRHALPGMRPGVSSPRLRPTVQPLTPAGNCGFVVGSCEKNELANN